ncbi:MAG: DUF1294 domain-containing protein [Ruminococcus sp.]|nr:DUF1294 domain-containing protein [Ruminococcus sp.]
MDRILVLYLFWMNILTFIVFWLDKWKAVHGKWRIRVSVLLGLSFFGGALGGLCAMYLFRHKTQKVCFKIGLPVMLIAQIILLIYIKAAVIV